MARNDAPAASAKVRHLSGGLGRCITDVDGLRLGHAQRSGRGWCTGTTVIRCDEGAVGGVDVRGAAPGTRETDLLRPDALVERVHAACLTGGSAFGLAAADGVMRWCEQRSIGFPIGGSITPPSVVPLVPTAVIFDLGRGGVIANRPDASFGYRAAAAARTRPAALGSVGAGTGALAGGLRGGFGTWSETVGTDAAGRPIVVAAAVVVNAIGAVVELGSGLPWWQAPTTAMDTPRRAPTRADRDALATLLAPPAAQAAQPSALNTTIGVVATNATLSTAECCKVAAVGHDGLARAVRPAHSMFDGDTLFALSTERVTLPTFIDDGRAEHARRARAQAFNALLSVAADCVATAVVRAVCAAAPGGLRPTYREICPSAFARR